MQSDWYWRELRNEKDEHGSYSISTAFYWNVLPKGGVRIIKNEWKTAIYCQRNLQRRCLIARGGLRDEKDEHGNYSISTAFCLNVLPERRVQIITAAINWVTAIYRQSKPNGYFARTFSSSLESHQVEYFCER